MIRKEKKTSKLTDRINFYYMRHHTTKIRENTNLSQDSPDMFPFPCYAFTLWGTIYSRWSNSFTQTDISFDILYVLLVGESCCEVFNISFTLNLSSLPSQKNIYPENTGRLINDSDTLLNCHSSFPCFIYYLYFSFIGF